MLSLTAAVQCIPQRPHKMVLTSSMTALLLLGWRGQVITDRGPVDSTAVLCCWKHLVEVSTLRQRQRWPSRAQQHALATGRVCTHACLFKHVTVCHSQSHQSLSVKAVLGGGGVRGGGVIGKGAPAAGSRPALQQTLQLSGHAAGESRVDPRVGTRVQTGQQHQDGEGHSCRGQVQKHSTFFEFVPCFTLFLLFLCQLVLFCFYFLLF